MPPARMGRPLGGPPVVNPCRATLCEKGVGPRPPRVRVGRGGCAAFPARLVCHAREPGERLAPWAGRMTRHLNGRGPTPPAVWPRIPGPWPGRPSSRHPRQAPSQPPAHRPRIRRKPLSTSPPPAPVQDFVVGHVRQDAPTPEATDRCHGHSSPASPAKPIIGPPFEPRPTRLVELLVRTLHQASSHRQLASELLHPRPTTACQRRCERPSAHVEERTPSPFSGEAASDVLRDAQWHRDRWSRRIVRRFPWPRFSVRCCRFRIRGTSG